MTASRSASASACVWFFLMGVVYSRGCLCWGCVVVMVGADGQHKESYGWVVVYT